MATRKEWFVAIAVTVLMVVWIIGYGSDERAAARRCVSEFSIARTAADSLRVVFYDRQCLDTMRLPLEAEAIKP
jgi:hypothetical protein